MRTTISVPATELERVDRLAAQHGMSRSQFYLRAARRFADHLERNDALTAQANPAIERAGQPSEGLFLRASEDVISGGIGRSTG
ncbi:ribbon-helix-helix protein, CopG family [Puerhibacterium sp. TATVAM-FAB25]|uniref:ribbon-helix-helix protein, CopG family n=1 Tax=Puerhibacterium sp. TATVAM-FAB25 TaxID=3093699 RepID=UPI003977E85F